MPRTLTDLILPLCLILALGAVLGVGVWGGEMGRDEHQFVAAAHLVGQGLLPYRDFPHFHVPHLAWVQAAAQGLTGSPLIGARLVNLLAALGVLALIWGAARSSLRREPAWLSAAWAAWLVAALGSSALFLYTAGQAWNHDLAALLGAAAFWAAWRALARSGPGPWLAAGLLLGLAACVRLSWAPLGPPFLAAALWPAAGGGVRWRSGLALAGGVVLACLPLLALLALAPEQTWFDVLTYSLTINPQYYAQAGATEQVAWAGKLAFLWHDILWQRGYFLVLGTARLNLLLAGLAAPLALAGAWRAWGAGPVARRRLALAAACLALALLGAMAPSPNMTQYYYQALVLGLLVLGLGLGRALEGLRALGGRPLVAGLTALALVIAGLGLYRTLRHTQVNAWPAAREAAARRGQALAGLAPAAARGPILTLAPAWVLEAGGRIYPALAPGPFAFRTAHLVPPEERRRLGLVAPADLADLVRSRPPVGVLTGAEPNWEAPLIRLARDLGFQPHPLPGGLTLWLPPGP